MNKDEIEGTAHKVVGKLKRRSATRHRPYHPQG